MNSFEINKDSMIEEMIITGLKMRKYETIMNLVNHTNVFTNNDFRKVYDNFYVVRRNIHWRDKYFSIFQEQKKEALDFDKLLLKVYKETGNVEPSFTSKMLASLNSNMPIWDKYVIEKLGYKRILQSYSTKPAMEKISFFSEIYKQIIEWYHNYLITENAKEVIKLFDNTIPSFSWLSEVKKIDFCLWSMRNEDIEE